MKHFFVFLALALVLAGCAGRATSAPVVTDTQAPQPSSTFAPTMTPSPTLLGTSTPEAPSATPTSEGTPEAELSCRVLSQSVKNGQHFNPKERFEVGWSVRNNGTATWDPISVDFEYFSGTKMYRFSPAQLPISVAPHSAPVVLGADLVAPMNPGKYSTVWTLRRGQDDFCHVSVSIVVP